MITNTTRTLAAALSAAALLAVPLYAADVPATKKEKLAAAKKEAAAPAAPAVPAVPAAAPAGVNPTSDDEKSIYAIGLAISQNLANFKLTEADLKFLQAGLADGVLARPPKLELSEWMPKIQAFAESRSKVVAAEEKVAGEAYLAKMAKEPGAKATGSGVLMFEITPGTGATPKATDKVKVFYTGSLIDGTVFDGNVGREPAVFSLGAVVGCWVEGLQMMKVGGKAKFVCPSSMGWGDRGSPPKIAPGAVTIFEIELLGIE